MLRLVPRREWLLSAFALSFSTRLKLIMCSSTIHQCLTAIFCCGLCVSRRRPFVLLTLSPLNVFPLRVNPSAKRLREGP